MEEVKIICCNNDLKIQVWLPHKTGSNTVRFILNHFDFHTLILPSAQKTKTIYNYLNGANNTDLDSGFESYKLVSTVRNPYLRFISFNYFYNQINSQTQIDISNFDLALNRVRGILRNEPESFRLKRPDYLIRTENMLEDLLKLDFIKESKLNQCGILEDLTQKRFNNSNRPDDWKDLYDQEKADKVYKLFEHIFELGIYDRDSWRQ